MRDTKLFDEHIPRLRRYALSGEIERPQFLRIAESVYRALNP